MSEIYKICNRCIMDTSDPEIQFNDKGVCNHCRNQIEFTEKYGYDKNISEAKLTKIINQIKENGKGKEYDAILGISGGVDSAYLMYLAHEWGLRILAVHVDAGWNTDTAVNNIEKLCKSLNIDLHTVVVDWPTMKELQRAYMFSGLPNLDIPQDHAFLAAMYNYAHKYKVKYMLNGSNYATEAILPKAWGYDAMDFTSIKDVYKKCGRGKSLKKYPKVSLLKYYYVLFAVKRVNLLNCVDYSKTKAIKLLGEKFDWNYYGGKHFESRFTRFFQSYYLPRKFGYDKRRAHLSSLVINGELSREEALDEMQRPPYDSQLMMEDLEYILKKLDITKEEWETIMNAPNKTESAYKNQKKTRKFILECVRKFRKVLKKSKKR